jgi:hypothetical protein
MAQPMSGKDSSPVVRSNDPISIFAKEEKKTMSRNKITEQPQIPAEQPQIAPVQPQMDLKALVEQRKTLSEQIRAAKAATPQQDRLERVLARQAGQLPWVQVRLAARIRARVAAGQAADVALETVLAEVRAAVVAQLAKPASAADESAE